MTIETFGENSVLGQLPYGVGPLGFSPWLPLQDIIPSYLYQQYSDDPSLRAFVSAYNALAQGYLDWFNNTPLSVYTDPNINGPLLDWIGCGLYGIPRPVISTPATIQSGALNSIQLNAVALNSEIVLATGSAQLANDDIYKRTLTWNLYLGDGKVMTIDWLKRRFARFLYASNGLDITPDAGYNIGIAVTQGSSPTFEMSVPTIAPITSIMQNFIDQSILQMPLEINYTITAR